MTKSKLKVNMVSESEFTVQGQGVHTAYVELAKALKKCHDVDLSINSTGEFDIAHVHTLGLYSLKKLKTGKKAVITAHIVPDSLIGSIKGAKYWKSLGKWWMKYFYAKADKVLACSGMVAEELEGNMGLANVDVFYNSIDMSNYHSSDKEKLAARKEMKIAKDAFVVVGNGQVQPRKRFDIFVKLAKKMPETTFFWVGGIPFKQLGANYSEMKSLMDNAPKNLIVTGVITLEEVKKYYQVADVFCLPAEQENHPMSVLEAAGSGLPIVLRDIKNYNDTFKPNALFAKKDDDFLKIMKKLRDNLSFRREYAQKAKIIADRFDSVAAADELVKIYQKLLKTTS